jgi:transposase
LRIAASGEEAVVTLKLVDTAPEEARIVELSERLNRAVSARTEHVSRARHLLDELDASYLDAAREMLGILSGKISSCTSGGIPLTRQQIETYLDFDPAYLDTAIAMLTDFIARRERR